MMHLDQILYGVPSVLSLIVSTSLQPIAGNDWGDILIQFPIVVIVITIVAYFMKYIKTKDETHAKERDELLEKSRQERTAFLEADTKEREKWQEIISNMNNEVIIAITKAQQTMVEVEKTLRELKS